MSTFITRFGSTGGGLRVAVKDLIDLAGTPTTNGSRVLAAKAAPAEEDAPCLKGTRQAEAAGEIAIVGKTNLHELAFGVSGINPWFGTPVNPLDPELVPGGSSSGSAVAVGSGQADIAFGSDTGGSIRIPAACCGVVGLKTTRGRIPLQGVRPLAPSLDTVGPMAATVGLTATGMSLLEPGFAVAAQPAARLGRVRLPAAVHIDEAIDRALTRSGIHTEEVVCPGWDEANSAALRILMWEAWQTHADLWKAHGPELSPDVSARLEASSLIDAEEVAASWEQARAWAREVTALFDQVDLLVLPALADDPPTLANAARVTEIRYAAPFNLTGTPALALPVATTTGLPASLQLAGPARSEALILATAAVIESAVAPTL